MAVFGMIVDVWTAVVVIVSAVAAFVIADVSDVVTEFVFEIDNSVLRFVYVYMICICVRVQCSWPPPCTPMVWSGPIEN